MTAIELQDEIAKCEAAEREAHDRAVALRACLRARQKLDEQIAEADKRAMIAAGKTT